MKANGIKAMIALAGAALAAYFKSLAAPLVVLVVVMLTDYVTGMVRAWLTKTFSSKKGIQGIVKKLLFLVLVSVGTAVDYLLTSARSRVGVEAPVTGVIALTVIVWLIINELISILENLGQAGVPIPAFLTKLVERLKVTTEKKADLADDDEKK